MWRVIVVAALLLGIGCNGAVAGDVYMTGGSVGGEAKRIADAEIHLIPANAANTALIKQSCGDYTQHNATAADGAARREARRRAYQDSAGNEYQRARGETA